MTTKNGINEMMGQNGPPMRERRASFSSSTTTEDSGYSPSIRQIVQESVQAFHTHDEYISAMTEDLADWFNHQYRTNIAAENFFEKIEDGVLLCRHATELHRCAQEFQTAGQTFSMKVGGSKIRIPQQAPKFKATASPGSYYARDNIANFILWCRDWGIPDNLSFETEDLVCRKNNRSVIICMLEIARIGAKFGMEVPEIVQLEQEIDAELESEAAEAEARSKTQDVDVQSLDSVDASTDYPDHSRFEANNLRQTTETGVGAQSDSDDSGSVNLKHQRPKNNHIIAAPANGRKRNMPTVDMKSLDELVREVLAMCTCKDMFHMKRVREGEYLFGEKSVRIFVRILRNHVMVRVGGGWDTLNHFLERHDPCRKDQQTFTSGISNCSSLLKPTSTSSGSTDTVTDQSPDLPPLAPPVGRARKDFVPPTHGIQEGMMTATTTRPGAGAGRRRASCVALLPSYSPLTPERTTGERRRRESRPDPPRLEHLQIDEQPEPLEGSPIRLRAATIFTDTQDTQLNTTIVVSQSMDCLRLSALSPVGDSTRPLSVTTGIISPALNEVQQFARRFRHKAPTRTLNLLRSSTPTSLSRIPIPNGRRPSNPGGFSVVLEAPNSQ